MAAVTPASRPDAQHDRVGMGQKVRRFYFTSVGNGDTFAHGIDGVTRVAWEADNNGDVCSVVNSGTTATWASAGNVDGHLIVWSRS